MISCLPLDAVASRFINPRATTSVDEPSIRHVLWRLRRVLGFTPADNVEALFRLKQQTDASAASAWQAGSFCFPWGRWDYVHAGQLRSQFEEIFIERQYAFSTDRPNPVIIDCGGNIGLSAIWFKLTYPGCRLTVFEADPDLAELSRQNLRRAGFDDVQVRSVAVWNANEKVAFRKTGNDSGSIARDGTMTCSAVDLSECLPERVDLLKLDIEGAEFAVLDRLCDTGAIRRVQNLVCEFHVWRDMTDHLLRTLANLRSKDMQLSITAAAVPWIGLADEEAPFGRIGRHHVLMEVFAWRRNV